MNALHTLGNAAAAAWRALGAAVKGEELVVSPIAEAGRMRACISCDRLESKRCKECGCFVALKTKLATENCPLNRWP
jgi:hypothetical protein